MITVCSRTTETTFDGQHYQLARRPLRAQAGAAAAPADLHRRQRPERARCGPSPAGRSTGTPRRHPEEFAASTTCCTSTAPTSGATRSEITTSTHLRVDAGDLGRRRAGDRRPAEAGLDLGIVYLPPPHTPAVLEPLAAALAPLAG